MQATRRRWLRYAATAGASLFLAACERGRPGSNAGRTRPPAEQGALRFDFRHFIASGTEHFSLVRLRAEPLWSGSRARGLAMPDWGDYRFSVFDSESGDPLFRSGFDSNLDRGAQSNATQVSIRIPAPDRAVNAVIERRRATGVFQPVWDGTIDPADSAIDRSQSALRTRVDTILSNGEPAAKVDIAILGDGYVESQYPKFIADARRAAEYLFSVDPFKKRVQDFNVHSVFAASTDAGVTDPYLGLRKDTVFGCGYQAGMAERTLAVGDETALREAATAAPYDFLLVIANARRYGGSAYFGGPAVVAIDSAAARYLVIHEFAHVVGGLADEYYIPSGSGPVYAGNIEPWNPNVTPAARHAKWSSAEMHPTAWNKAEYDRYFKGYVNRYTALRNAHVDEAVVETFMNAESKRQATLLARNADPLRVGLFEGANGYARGVFRAQVDCIMFSLQTDYFCSACAGALDAALDALTRPRSR